jgi:methylmalonyl-CoA mutase
MGENVHRHRANRYLKKMGGPEHLHLLDQFSLKVMGDIAQFFVHNRVRNFYSVHQRLPHRRSGDQPISQLAFTLSNGFTAVDVSRTRHAHRRLRAHVVSSSATAWTRIHRDGRVARRIWAVAMKEVLAQRRAQ